MRYARQQLRHRGEPNRFVIDISHGRVLLENEPSFEFLMA